MTRASDTAAPERTETIATDCANTTADDKVAAITLIKERQYESFLEDHEPRPWTPGQCAGYAGRGSLALHLFRCKRRSGHGVGGLFCRQHATGDFESVERAQ